MSDFIKRKHEQTMKEFEALVVLWRLADRVEYDPSSHRKMRIKARQDKESISNDWRRLIDTLNYLDKNK